MGAWSHTPFGNDTACDWAYDLEGATNFSLVEAAIQQVLDADGYLDADEAMEAVAAAEVLAKVLGKGTQKDTYTEDIDSWVSSLVVKPSQDLLSKAQLALMRIMAEESELNELWEDSDDFEEWRSSMENLGRALNQ